MPDYNIEMLVEENALVGEGPCWDPHLAVLYWTDIRTGRVFKYDPETGDNELIHHGKYVGGIAINKQGVVFIWPVRLPGQDGKIDDWSRSAIEAADMAGREWVRVTSNMSLGAYEVHTAQAELGDPTWPTQDFRELLRIAFKDRHITDLDHPVLQRLRGET